MNKIVVAVIVAATAATVATPAYAQSDQPFTGFRLEAIGGWDRVQVDGDHDNGVTFGAGVGYDFQLGGAVIGIEGEASDSTTKECAGDVLEIGDELCIKAGRDFYAGARVGAVVGTSTLLYAKGGYTNARATVDYDAAPAGLLTDEEVSDNLDGYRVGVGAEHKLGQNTFLKAEYRYSNYEGSFARHQVVGGVGFRF